MSGHLVGLGVCHSSEQAGYFGLWLFGLGSIRWPNKSVKGTHRPLAVLKFGFFQGSAASFRFRERRAPYLYVGQS